MAYRNSEEVRGNLESTNGWQYILSSEVNYLRIGGLCNVNAGSTMTMSREDVLDCLHKDFIQSWCGRCHRSFTTTRTRSSTEPTTQTPAVYRNTQRWERWGHALCSSSHIVHLLIALQSCRTTDAFRPMTTPIYSPWFPGLVFGTPRWNCSCRYTPIVCATIGYVFLLHFP